MTVLEEEREREEEGEKERVGEVGVWVVQTGPSSPVD